MNRDSSPVSSLYPVELCPNFFCHLFFLFLIIIVGNLSRVSTHVCVKSYQIVSKKSSQMWHNLKNQTECFLFAAGKVAPITFLSFSVALICFSCWVIIITIINYYYYCCCCCSVAVVIKIQRLFDRKNNYDVK